MVACQNCHDTPTVHNGCVRDKPRDTCQRCGDNFVRGDERHSHAPEGKKAVCLLLSSLGQASCGFVAKLLGVSRTTTYDWIRPAAASTDEPTIAEDMQAIEWDERWHLMHSNKETCGS
jgi:transposase-like protein